MDNGYEEFTQRELEEISEKQEQITHDFYDDLLRDDYYDKLHKRQEAEEFRRNKYKYFRRWDHNDFAKNDFKGEDVKMAKIQAKQNGNKVWTGEVRLSYANVWAPSKQMGSEQEKYSASLIIPKTDKGTIEAINKAIEVAKENGKSKKWNGKIPKSLTLPLHDGDLDREDNEEYANSYFVNAKSNDKPGIVDANTAPIMDQSEVYSGCYVRATITFYPYDINGNKGIAVGLGNIQKLRDGESLGGSPVKAEDDFDEVELDDDILD